MFVATPLVPDNAPLVRSTSHGSGRIVWQQRYEGIAQVAYRGGKAIAGVSGPWSDRYALIWWDERPAASNPLELFETIEAAMRAVEERSGRAMPKIAAANEAQFAVRRGWWQQLWPLRRQRSVAQTRRQACAGEIDLTGLNFSASR